MKPHQKIVKIEKDGVIHLIPQKPIREMRGFIKGMDTSQLRRTGPLVKLIECNSEIITSDKHLKDLKNVKFINK